MTSVAHRIYKLLDLDDKLPNVEVLAKARLKELDIACISCSRCDGSGTYKLRASYDGTCFKCNGRGATGIRLTKIALSQLKALLDDGTLLKKQQRWNGHEFVRKARFCLVQFVAATGVATQYGHVTQEAFIGDWDYDVRSIHHRMTNVIARYSKLVDVDLFATMSNQQQLDNIPLYRESYQAALDHLTKLNIELGIYTSWHVKPDYRKQCLGMAKKLRDYQH